MYEHFPIYPVADAGYGSYDNYSYCLEIGLGLYQTMACGQKKETGKP